MVYVLPWFGIPRLKHILRGDTDHMGGVGRRVVQEPHSEITQEVKVYPHILVSYVSYGRNKRLFTHCFFTARRLSVFRRGCARAEPECTSAIYSKRGEGGLGVTRPQHKPGTLRHPLSHLTPPSGCDGKTITHRGRLNNSGRRFLTRSDSWTREKGREGRVFESKQRTGTHKKHTRTHRVQGLLSVERCPG
jgi:hypothetical protein